MKKSLLAFSALLTGSAAFAQISITQNDIGPVYNVIEQARDTTPTVTQGGSGANQTWNFAALANQAMDTMTFTMPSYTPYDTAFQNANLAVVQRSNGFDSYLYLEKNPATLDAWGQAMQNPFGSGTVVLGFNDPERMATFPMTYNTSFNDMATSNAQFYFGQDLGFGQIDSVRIKTIVYKNSLVDGWGTCITPLGTYNAIRQNTMRTQYDTIDIYMFGSWIDDAFTQEDSARTYSYWANNMGMPVVDLVDDQNLGTITQARWISAQPQLIGIPEQNKAKTVSLYPNPASGTLFIETAEAKAAWAEIYSTDGRLLLRRELNGPRTQLDLDLASGFYLWQVSDANGKPLDKGKLCITK